MLEAPNISSGTIGATLDFYTHIYDYLDIDAVEIIRDSLKKNAGSHSVPEFLYGNQRCSLKFSWQKEEEQFSFLAIIEPLHKARVGEVYPYMLPPVQPSSSSDQNQSRRSLPQVDTRPFHLYDMIPQDLSWVYVYTSQSSNSNVLDEWLEKIDAISPQLNTTKKLKELSKAAKDNNSLEAWRGGLYLFGHLGLDSIVPNKTEFDHYFGMNGSFTTLPFYGFLHYPLYFPQLTFHVPLVTGLDEGPLKLDEVFLELTSPTYYIPGQTDIGFGAKLEIGSEKLTIKAIWPIGSDRIKASARIIGSIPFVDTASIPGLGSFKPTAAIDLELDLSISGKSILRAAFELEVENWVLIDKLLVLEDLDFQITVLEPGTQNLVMASIQATALLGSSGIRLFAMGEYPSKQFSFRLDPATPIHINELLGSFTGKHPALDEGLVIDQFEGWVNASSGHASFSTGVSGSWKPGFLDIELTSLHFNISKNEHWSFGVSSNFSLHDVDFLVTALYNDGWFFAAKAADIELGVFLSNLSPETSLPESLQSLKIAELLFEFNTHSGDYQMRGQGFITMNDKDIRAEILVKATNSNGNKKTSFSGRLVVEEKYFFDLSFSSDAPNERLLLAAYHDEGKESLKLGELLKGLGLDPAPNINIQVKDAVLASRSAPGDIPGSKTTKNLFISDIEGGINLSNLPLVGTLFQGSNSVKLAFHVQYATDTFDANAVGQINAHLPNGMPQLLPSPLEDGKEMGLAKGVGLSINMQIGDRMIPMDFPLKAKESNRAPTQTVSRTNDTAVPHDPIIELDHTKPQQPDIKWFAIQKHIGPVYFKRMGVSYSSGKFTFTIDASLSMSGLTLSLIELSVTSGIEKFDPHFGLKGLGLDFANGPLEIGGSFLREQVERNGKIVDDYSGTALIKTEAFSLMAMGGYTTIDDHPSLFLYAILDKQIGGPSFFFVEGLAAGFGYNRKLIIPSIDQVEHFPLIVAANAGVPEHVDPTAALQSLREYIPPSVGDIFLAIGVKFNSFKQVHSFALLTLSFGHKVELHLLGISNLLVPSEIESGQSPVARIEMVLSGTYIPEEGFLGIQTQLTSNSYILSKACKLTGGFAFFSWFSGQHNGDYIVTLGGYHSEFIPPSHYPQHVPRLGFNWTIDSHTVIKGEAYYALCSHAFMVGGHLEASYHSGAFAASFKAGADFLITWKPYHYDAHIYVEISASYTYHFFGTHHISVGLGADIHLSGPEFGGTAKVHIWIVSITVHFGQGKGGPKPIEWEKFKTSFLPAPEKILSATINHGLVSGTNNPNHLGIVNPKKFQLTVESVIPSKYVLVNGRHVEKEHFTTFGIGPMGIPKVDNASLSVLIKGPNNSHEQLKTKPLNKKVPAALWGSKLTPAVNDPSFVENALMGVVISLEEQPQGQRTQLILREELVGGDPLKLINSFAWKAPSLLPNTMEKKNVDPKKESRQRNELLSALALDVEIDLAQFDASDYLFTLPQSK